MVRRLGVKLCKDEFFFFFFSIRLFSKIIEIEKLKNGRFSERIAVDFCDGLGTHEDHVHKADHMTLEFRSQISRIPGL